MAEDARARNEETWRVFLAYRRSDGAQVAEWLHLELGRDAHGRREARPKLDIYLDRAAPGTGDFRRISRPHLAASRALILICTPEARERRPGTDFLHDEIDWWLRHRRTAPILVDAARVGLTSIPPTVRARWPHAQIVECFPADWVADTESRLRLVERCIAQITRGIEISERGIRFEELRRLRLANGLLAAAVLAALALAAVASGLGMRWRRAEREAVRRGYAAEIAAAQRDVRAQDFGDARRRLAETDTTLRNWEWGHLLRVADRSVRRFQMSAAWVCCVAQSPDGRQLLGGSSDGWLRLWDIDAGDLVAEARHGDTWIAGVFPSSTAGFLTCDRAGLVREWDEGLRPRGPPAHIEGGGVIELHLSPDGTRFVTTCRDGSIRIHDAGRLSGAGRTLAEVDGEAVAGWSHDSQLIALGLFGGRVVVVEAATGRLVLDEAPLADAVTAVAFGPADLELVASDLRGLIAVLDAATGEVKGGLRPFDTDEQEAILCMTVLDGGVLLAGDSKHLIHAWNLQDKSSLGMWPGHDGDIQVLAPGPTGLSWFSGSDDGEARLWSLDPTDQPVRVVATDADVWSMVLAADGGSVFLGAHEGRVERRALAGELLAAADLPGAARVDQIVRDAAGTRLAALDENGTVHVLQAHDLSVLASPGDPDLRYCSAAFLDGALALGTGGPVVEPVHALEIRDLSSGALQATPVTGSFAIEALVVYADGSRVAVGSKSPALRLVDPAGLERPISWDEPELGIGALAADPVNGRLAAGASDGSILLIDEDSGRVLGRFRGHAGPVRCVAFSPDGERLFSGSEDGGVRVWDPASGRELLHLPQGNQVVFGLGLTPDGEQLVVACCEPLVRIWTSVSSRP